MTSAAGVNTIQKLDMPLHDWYRFVQSYRLFEYIEKEKELKAKGQSTWLRYASYHILYALRLIADCKRIGLQYPNPEKILKLYPKAKLSISKARKIEIANARSERREFADVLFFKSNTAKKNVEAFNSAPPS
jgi:hypothetical protein